MYRHYIVGTSIVDESTKYLAVSQFSCKAGDIVTVRRGCGKDFVMVEHGSFAECEGCEVALMEFLYGKKAELVIDHFDADYSFEDEEEAE